MLNVLDVQDALAAKLVSSVPYDCYEQAVPDIDDLPRDGNGNVPYYISYRFGMPQEKAAGKTFSGVEYDDYDQVFYVEVVGPEAENVRRIAFGHVLSAILGFSSEWTSQVRQRAGGAILAMTQSNGATEAYVAPLSFGVTFQMNPE